jgi:prepilin-type N-terminal cleavage/methylation domain-containing protein
MIATHKIRDARTRCGPSAPVSRGGFTLTELLVVIALIVLLVSLLLAALSQVKTQASKTRSLATMQAFRNACDAFQQEHGFYPGVVPEDILANDPQISGTENAILHLMGGYVRRADFAPGQAGNDEFNSYSTADGWVLLSFAMPNNGGDYLVKVNTRLYGEGPTINGKPYSAYYTPGRKELGIAPGQESASGIGGLELPDLLDAWGQPIIYLRRQRTIGPITSNLQNASPQFTPVSMSPYTSSTALGRLGEDQMMNSILNVAPDPINTLGKILGHAALSQYNGNTGEYTGQARGAYMLLSAGPDGVYFSQTDGPGNQSEPQPDILNMPSSVLEEYDDVLLFGGD